MLQTTPNLVSLHPKLSPISIQNPPWPTQNQHFIQLNSWALIASACRAPRKTYELLTCFREFHRELREPFGNLQITLKTSHVIQMNKYPLHPTNIDLCQPKFHPPKSCSGCATNFVHRRMGSCEWMAWMWSALVHTPFVQNVIVTCISTHAYHVITVTHNQPDFLPRPLPAYHPSRPHHIHMDNFRRPLPNYKYGGIHIVWFGVQLGLAYLFLRPLRAGSHYDHLREEKCFEQWKCRNA